MVLHKLRFSETVPSPHHTLHDHLRNQHDLTELLIIMHNLAPNLHVLEHPQQFLGLELGSRMTILQLAEGLLIHSPVDVDPKSVALLGEVRWVLSPNLFHHLHVGRWVEAGAEAWAAPGLSEKRRDVPFAGMISSKEQNPFGDEVRLYPLRCFPFSNEVVVLHQPSRTLLLTDLLFNFPPTAPWPTRLVMRCAGAYPGCRSSLLEQIEMHRDVARRELREILSWDFDRIVLAHGDVVESGGKAAMRNAYRWLDLLYAKCNLDNLPPSTFRNTRNNRHFLRFLTGLQHMDGTRVHEKQRWRFASRRAPYLNGVKARPYAHLSGCSRRMVVSGGLFLC
jgi:hypothetical protein